MHGLTDASVGRQAENMATQIQQSRTTASATPPLPDAGSDPMLEARLLQFENKLAAVEQVIINCRKNNCSTSHHSLTAHIVVFFLATRYNNMH